MWPSSPVREWLNFRTSMVRLLSNPYCILCVFRVCTLPGVHKHSRACSKQSYPEPELFNFTRALILLCWVGKRRVCHIFSSATWTESCKYCTLQSQKNQPLWVSQCHRKNFDWVCGYYCSEDAEMVWVLLQRETASSMLINLCRQALRSQLLVMLRRLLRELQWLLSSHVNMSYFYLLVSRDKLHSANK